MTKRWKLLKPLAQWKPGTHFVFMETPPGDKSYGPDGWFYSDGPGSVRWLFKVEGESGPRRWRSGVIAGCSETVLGGAGFPGF